MSSFQKFNDSVESMEQEVSKFKDLSFNYKRLGDLIKAYTEITNKFEENKLYLKELARLQEEKQKELAQDIIKQNENFGNNALDALAKTRNEISKGIIDLHTENKIVFETLKNNQESFEKAVSNLIDRFRQENKSFYFDLEKTVKIKLDENRSEIKKLIEDERQQIKEIFVTELSIGLQAVLNKQKRMQIILLVFGVLLTLLSSAILIKLLR